MSTSPPGVLLCNLKATFSFRRFFSFSLKDYVHSSLYRDGRLVDRGEGREVGRIRQSGGLKAPDKAEEGEDEEEEEGLQDVTEFRAEAVAAELSESGGTLAAIIFIILTLPASHLCQ